MKNVTLLGQRLSAANPTIEVSKTALLNVTRRDGRDRSSDVTDIEILFQKGLIQVEDGTQVVSSYEELLQIIDNGYIGTGGIPPSPFDGTPSPTGPAGDPGTSNEYARGDHVHEGASGGATPVFVWGPTTTWASLYAQIELLPASIVVIPNDGTAREMTPNPAGRTNLGKTWFIGLLGDSGNGPVINIDSLGVGGFELDLNTRMTSKDVFWRTYYRIGGGYDNPYWYFDGGGLSVVAGNDAMRHAYPTLIMRNGAEVKCWAGGTTVIASIISAKLVAQTGAKVGSKVFRGYAGPPPPVLNVIADASVEFAPDYVTNMSMPAINWADLAQQVYYDDLVVDPTTGASTVQDIIDLLKMGATGAPLRLTTAQRTALSPVDGTLVYDTDERKLYVFQADIDWPTWAEV